MKVFLSIPLYSSMDELVEMNKISLAKSVLAGAVLLAALRSVAQIKNSTAPATTQAPTATKATPQTAAKAT